jgi:hypothetical protein
MYTPITQQEMELYEKSKRIKLWVEEAAGMRDIYEKMTLSQQVSILEQVIEIVEFIAPTVDIQGLKNEFVNRQIDLWDKANGRVQK